VGLSLELIEGWSDITDTSKGLPFTMAREDGVGAFQFSVAHYKSGAEPNATIEDLIRMLASFFHAKALGEMSDVCSASDPLMVAGATSRIEGVVRVW
jgi:hypothetical protein